MDIEFNPKKHLKICKKIQKSHCLDRTKCMLGYVSRANNTCLYMVDFHEYKIILGNLSKHTFAGFPAELVRKEGLNIYNKILPKSEKEWFQKMINSADAIFSKYEDIETRMEVVFSYDLVCKTPGGRLLTLHHRLVPYQLDQEGNLWIGLCAVSPLPLTHKPMKACVECVKTGERFDYVDEKFVLSEQKYLTEEEIEILGHLADGLAMKQISAEMGISARLTERKKKEALDKLGAATQAAAVYRAKNMGLI